MGGTRYGLPVVLAAEGPLPLEVLAGKAAALVVRVSCPDRHDCTGLSIKVTGPASPEVSYVVAADPDGREAMAAIALTPPPQLGEHIFHLTISSHEFDGRLYSEAALDVPVRVMPQATSLAVWEVPSSAAMGATFTVRAGAKSAADVSLAGCAVELLDQAGDVIGRGRLGEMPFAGTGALYWCDVELVAPRCEGLADFSVRFTPDGIELPHHGSTTSFRVAIVPEAEHVLSVKVIEQTTCVPIEDVELRLGAYRSKTSDSGLAQIAVPKGSYELHLWKVGFEAPSRVLDIRGNAFVEIAVAAVPDEDPDARWRM